MFRFRNTAASPKAMLEALGRSLAVIEFQPDGTIISANENFCSVVGYAASEIRGQHHRIFVEPTYSQSTEYREFWAKLGRGQFESREYKRLTKNGREVWIQASYNPVLAANGQVVKIVKIATDITAAKLRSAEFESTLAAISRVQAVIEFKPSGEIITANAIFLSALGYKLSEIQGRHHRMFVDRSEADSTDYAEFWRKLNSGNFVSASFRRLGKGGQEIWIQASYNPVFDTNGKVLKIVKFANDITDLTAVGSGLSRLADNDLTSSIEHPFSPAFEKLRQNFNVAHDNLKSAILQVVEGARAIDGNSQQIQAANEDLSHRTEQQAASLEETAAALDEITATVRKTASGVAKASQTVNTARSHAEQSGAVVRQAVQAMSGIEKSSQQIGRIIGVIDEIAFQTNLLALNAGVEAARAGDAGRGFAVVASEVRALAQRSAEAAKEIKVLVNASTEQVNHGVRLVGRTGAALELIVAQVTEINGVVAEIANSAQEQATGLDQVNTAVNQMDQVTQQNAAMVEETTAASHALANEAKSLATLMAKFRVGADTSKVHQSERPNAPPLAPARSDGTRRMALT